MCVIIFNTYNAELVSFITAPKLRPVIESFADLSVSTQLQLAILQDSTFETIIMVCILVDCRRISLSQIRKKIIKYKLILGSRRRSIQIVG